MTAADYFETYEEWHDAITRRCGLTLTKTYCEERIRALSDPKDPSTCDFVERYGEGYRRKVVSWFERAGSNS
jgi:hypothetical protein